MQVTLLMAISLNGMIADAEGHEDFLSHDGWNVFVQMAEKMGVFVIGRKTYDAVSQNFVGFGFGDVLADRIIVSADTTMRAPEGYYVVNSPEQALALAAKLGHDSALLTGGAALNASFLEKNLINRLILNVEPVIVGAGTALFSGSDIITKLQFKKVEHRENGVLQLHYDVRY